MIHRIIAAITVILLFTAPAFAQSPWRASEELEDRGIYYDADSFLASVYTGDYPAIKLFLISDNSIAEILLRVSEIKLKM